MIFKNILQSQYLTKPYQISKHHLNYKNIINFSKYKPASIPIIQQSKDFFVYLKNTSYAKIQKPHAPQTYTNPIIIKIKDSDAIVKKGFLPHLQNLIFWSAASFGFYYFVNIYWALPGIIMTGIVLVSIGAGRIYMKRSITQIDLTDDHEHLNIQLLNNQKILCHIKQMYLREIVQLNPPSQAFSKKKYESKQKEKQQFEQQSSDSNIGDLNNQQQEKQQKLAKQESQEQNQIVESAFMLIFDITDVNNDQHNQLNCVINRQNLCMDNFNLAQEIMEHQIDKVRNYKFLNTQEYEESLEMLKKQEDENKKLEKKEESIDQIEQNQQPNQDQNLTQQQESNNKNENKDNKEKKL